MGVIDEATCYHFKYIFFIEKSFLPIFNAQTSNRCLSRTSLLFKHDNDS